MSINSFFPQTGWVYLHDIDFIRNEFLNDLRYVGFSQEDSDPFFTTTLPNHADRKRLKLRKSTVSKPTGTIKALFDYGFFILIRSANPKGKRIVNKSGQFSIRTSERVIIEKSLEAFLFRTIFISKWLFLVKRLKSNINPVPYAAYLFRMASLHNNPENKDVQEKALLLWKDKRSLELTFKLRFHTLEGIRNLNDIPESWIEETLIDNNFNTKNSKTGITI
jgi:hypothetical protein